VVFLDARRGAAFRFFEREIRPEVAFRAGGKTKRPVKARLFVSLETAPARW